MEDIFTAIRQQTVSHCEKFNLFLFQGLNESETAIIRPLKYCCDSVKFHLPGSCLFSSAVPAAQRELTAVHIF